MITTLFARAARRALAAHGLPGIPVPSGPACCPFLPDAGQGTPGARAPCPTPAPVAGGRRAPVRTRLGPCLLAAGLALLLPDPVRAAGGPFVVEAADIPAPGRGKLEAAFVAGPGGVWSLAAGVGGTPRGLPSLRLKAEFEVEGAGRARGTEMSVSAKWRLAELAPAGLGLALKAELSQELGSARPGWELAALATLAPADALRLHANLGAAGGPGGTRGRWALGAGWTPSGRLMVAAELFGRSDAPVGVQAGIRCLSPDQRLELDLLVARNLGGGRGMSLTLGSALRF